MRRFSFSTLAVLAALGCGAGRAHADTIVLKNGDRLTGTVLRVSPRVVRIKTSFAGTLKVARGSVKTLQTRGKTAVVGAHGAVRRRVLVENASGAGWHALPATTRVAPLKAARPRAVAAHVTPRVILVKEHRPGRQWNFEPYFLPVGPDWKDDLVLGFINAAGNDNLTQFSGRAAFHYKERRSSLTFSFNGLYGVNNGQHTEELASSDNHYHYDFDGSVRHPVFYFAENHDTYDGIKGISFRTVNGTGLGYFIRKTDRMQLSIRGGPGFTYQKLFSGQEYSDPDGLVGAHFSYKIDSEMNVSEDAFYTQSVTNQSHYLLHSRTALNISLSQLQRGLGLQFAFVDSYDNTTSPGRKRNDTRLIAGLQFNF